MSGRSRATSHAQRSRVLDVLRGSWPDPAPSSVLAARLRLSRTTVQHHLRDLAAAGLAARLGSGPSDWRWVAAHRPAGFRRRPAIPRPRRLGFREFLASMRPSTTAGIR